MKGFFCTLLLAVLLLMNNALLAQYEINAKRWTAQAMMDTLVKRDHIKNPNSNNDTWRLAIAIPTAMRLRPVREVLNLYFHNKLLTYRWNQEELHIYPTPLGDSLLKGYYTALYVTDPEGGPVYPAAVTVGSDSVAQQSDMSGMVLLPALQAGQKIRVRSGASWTDTLVTYSGGPVQEVSLQPKPMPTHVTKAFGGRTGFGNARDVCGTVVGYKLYDGQMAGVGDRVTDQLRNIPHYLPPVPSNTGRERMAGLLRGPVTLRGNNKPLYIVEDQPMENIDMLDPNDIDSIYVIRGASWTPLYGTRGSNGIIVIKLKESRSNKFHLSFKEQLAFSAAPNIYSNPVINSSDYINLQEDLFAKGVYNQREQEHLPLSPIVEALIKQRDSIITPLQYQALAAWYRSQDVRDYLARLYYQRAQWQQYYLNLSAGYKGFKYYASLGHSRHLFPEQGNSEQRTTLQLSTQYNRNYFQWHSRYLFTSFQHAYNPFVMSAAIPYLPLVDAQNRPLPVPYYGRPAYLDTLLGGKYLPYEMRPIEEWNLNNNKSYQQYLVLNEALTLRLFKGFLVNALYQLTTSTTTGRVLYNADSYFVRDQLNRNAQLVNGTMQWNVPPGNMLDKSDSRTVIHDARLQFDYNHSWGSFSLSSLAGGEIQSVKSRYTNSRLYAVGTDLEQVAAGAAASDTTNFIIAGYLGNTIVYKDRVFLSMGVRSDQSNRFGPKAMTEGLFYSAGLRLQLDRFPGYPAGAPVIGLLASIGESGNDNRELLKSTTLRDAGFNPFNLPVASIDNSGNGRLAAERMRVINIGTRISSRDSNLMVSLDYYWKKGNNLYGQQAMNATVGYSYQVNNSSSLQGHGFDLSVIARYGTAPFRQETRCWLSGIFTAVTSKELLLDEAWKYADPALSVPRQGDPVYGVYAFRLAPLDSTGNPVGYKDGKRSTDYGAITKSSKASDISCIGSAIPLYFGSITHTLKLVELLSLTVQISAQFKYYYRALSYSPSGLIAGTNNHGDFNNRFLQKGDELKTAIPAMVTEENKAREAIWQYGDALVRPADQVRLDYVQLGLTADKSRFKFMRSESLLVYFTICNLGILWRKNKQHEDPDAVNNPYPTPTSFCFTVKYVH